METKSHTKNVTERIQRSNQKSKTILKFQKIFKQNNSSTTHFRQKKYLHDQQAIRDIIKSLKQEICELKQVAKIQQTQLHYFKEQQKQLVMNSTSEIDKKKLLHMNLCLKQKNCHLEEECSRIKKLCKYTNIKQLQLANMQYLQQIKELNAKLKSGINVGKSNIEQLNSIIQRQYLGSLKISELSRIMDEKSSQIDQHKKNIRRLKNLNNLKNRETEELRDKIEQLGKQSDKHKNLQEYVHKSELQSKKKQLLSLSQTIENLQIKLNECQNKAQQLQQQNIENMNRQAMKRKQLLIAYQNMKQKCGQLQNLLLMSNNTNKLTDGTAQNIRLDKMPTQSELINKSKHPLFVTPDDVSAMLQQMVYTLQNKQITKQQAIDKILAQANTPVLRSRLIQQSSNCITIRNIMYVLDSEPFCISQYHQKQLFARYCAEDSSEDDQYVQFDRNVNVQYVRSVLKKVIPDYNVFSSDEKIFQCSQVQKFLNKSYYLLQQTLKSQNSVKTSNMQQSTLKADYLCSDIVNTIIKQKQLTDRTIDYIKYRIFPVRDQQLKLEQFQNNFNTNSLLNTDGDNGTAETGQFCLFLTQRQKQEQQHQQVKFENIMSAEIDSSKLSEQANLESNVHNFESNDQDILNDTLN